MKNYKFLIFILFLIINSCSKQDEINQLNQTILDLQANISQLNSQINDYLVQINQLTSQNNNSSIQIENLNNQLSGFLTEIENYLNQIEVLNDQNLLLESEKNNLTNQLTELQDQLDLIQAKEDEINQLNQTILDLQSNISQLNSRINEFSSQINLLTNQNNDLTNQLSGAQVQIEDLANQLNGLEVEIENYLNQIEVLNDQNLLLESEKNNLTNQLTELQDQLDLIQSQGAEDGVYIFNQIEISDPPFAGTMWDLPDLIKPSDYTVYSSSTYQGILDRLFYDRSIPDFITYPAHVYKVNFGDNLSVDFEIYSEFTQEEASNLEQKYAPLMGQLGKELRKNIKSIEFLKGEEVATAQRSDDLSYANITFHTDWLNNIVETRPDGDRTEELLIHEATHLSIDPYVYGQQGWTDAVNLDGNYLSTYAKDNPDSEDIAETFQAYIAVKYFPERITTSLRDTILSVCLNRFKYFDSLNLDLSIYK